MGNNENNGSLINEITLSIKYCLPILQMKYPQNIFPGMFKPSMNHLTYIKHLNSYACAIAF